MNVINWLYGRSREKNPEVPSKESEEKFVLKIGDLEIGSLSVKDSLWYFQYSEAFKTQDKYRRLIGFSDVNKIYQSEVLWPFFKLRIPGLKQPMIQEILEKEAIKADDEVSLLKRFGKRNISNPYILEVETQQQ